MGHSNGGHGNGWNGFGWNQWAWWLGVGWWWAWWCGAWWCSYADGCMVNLILLCSLSLYWPQPSALLLLACDTAGYFDFTVFCFFFFFVSKYFFFTQGYLRLFNVSINFILYPWPVLEFYPKICYPQIEIIEKSIYAWKVFFLFIFWIQ